MIIGDIIIQNEPTPALRVLAAQLLELDGDLLPLATAFVVGQSKISKAGGAFVNTANLPVAIADGGDGAFNLQLTQAEVDTVGKYRWRVTPTGGKLFEIAFDVRAAAAVDVNAVVAAIFAFISDPSAPANHRTFQEQWNNLVAYECSEADGIDGPIFAVKSADGTKTRLGGTVQSGKRRFTTRDGRP